MITIPLDDPQSNSKDAKKNDKYNAGSIASLSQENQIDNISGDVSQKSLCRGSTTECTISALKNPR